MDYNYELDKFAFWLGFIVGVLITAFVWFNVAVAAERLKVRDGYLTLDNKVYSVELFDTLDKPNKNKGE